MYINKQQGSQDYIYTCKWVLLKFIMLEMYQQFACIRYTYFISLNHACIRYTYFISLNHGSFCSTNALHVTLHDCFQHFWIFWSTFHKHYSFASSYCNANTCLTLSNVFGIKLIHYIGLCVCVSLVQLSVIIVLWGFDFVQSWITLVCACLPWNSLKYKFQSKSITVENEWNIWFTVCTVD